jgi:hypothetical protein
MNRFRVELKVCEGCGALWTRAATDGVYCRGCAVWLSEFPVAGLHRKPVGKRKAAMAVAGGAR